MAQTGHHTRQLSKQVFNKTCWKFTESHKFIFVGAKDISMRFIHGGVDYGQNSHHLYFKLWSNIS